MANIKPGYKQTEIGVIPEDWEMEEIENLGSFAKGAGITKDEAQSGNLPCVRYGELYTKHHEIIRNFYSFISEEISKNSKKLKYGDILFSCSGETREDIGKCATFLSDGTAYAGGDIIIFSPYFDNPKFLGYLLNSSKIAQQKANFGQGDAVVHINAKSIGSILIPLPPLEEQKAIAEVLSDMDGLIESLERSIAKRRNIKTGTMQRLLTGQKRLPGFEKKPGYKQTEIGIIPEDWEVMSLGDCAKIQRGASPRPISSPIWFDNKSSVGWLRISDVSKSKKYLKETTQNLSEIGIANSRFVAEQNLVMSICATVGRPIITCKNLCIHDGFVVFYEITDDKEYMYYALSNIESDWSKYGQTGSQMNLNTELINNTKIPLPPLEEQKAIAEVLSDMDAEIDALEDRLEKARNIKAGMMQELLTGKTRLIKIEERSLKAFPKYNQHFENAVIIAMLADRFASNEYPLSRFRYTKLSYLLYRYHKKSTEQYSKKAAGPYNNKTRYKGAEKIAQEKNYIQKIKNGPYEGFIAKEIKEPQKYFNDWFGEETLSWLKNFKYTKNDKLEVLTTVDMTIQDLKNESIEISVLSIKNRIKSIKEWKEKLERPAFSDKNIQEAIDESQKLFKEE